MAFSVKDWQDAPSTVTPITAAALEDMEGRLSAYTDALAPARVDNIGALGSTETLDVDGDPEVWLIGTLDANVTITISNLGEGGTVRLFLTQDATGGRSATVTDGVTSQSAAVIPTALAMTEVIVYSPDGSSLVVVAPADAAASLAVFGPTDHGLLAWNHDIALAGNAGAGSAQDVLHLMKVKVPQTLSVTNLHYFLAGTAPSAVTGGTLSLFSSAGTRLGITAAQTTAWQSLGYKSHAITGGPISVPGGPGVFVWVGLHCEAITGTWSPLRATNSTDQPNIGLTASTGRAATQNLTTVPSSITPASNTLNANVLWVGMS